MKLYVFDSCPFCVRVRALIGLKKIDCDLEYLVAGDLPVNLKTKVERFTVPMLEMVCDSTGKTIIMQESVDILRYLDRNGQAPALDGYEVSASVSDWLNIISTSLDLLCYPRMRLLQLPELGSENARVFFEVTRKERLGMSLQQALENTEQLVACAEEHLINLQSLIDIEGLLEGVRKVSVDDFYLFAVLRNLAMVHELHMPDLVNRYLVYLSNVTAVPLYPKISRLDFETQRAIQ